MTGAWFAGLRGGEGGGGGLCALDGDKDEPNSMKHHSGSVYIVDTEVAEEVCPISYTRSAMGRKEICDPRPWW